MLGKIAVRRDFVLVEHAPVSDLSDTLSRISAVADLFRRGAPHRLLIDLRWIHPAWAPEEAHTIAGKARDLFPTDLRTAMLVRPGLKDPRICEVIRLRREDGARLEAFHHRGPAVAWLAEDEANGVDLPGCAA